METTKEKPEVQKILQFLDEIGISVVERELNDTTFLPGITIGNKGIEVDFNQLLYPGDLLHEAGHIAVTSAAERKLIGTPSMPADWPTQGDEIVAMLWSYAALKHLEIPIEYVFHPHGYKNESTWLIANYTNQNFIGLPLLEWMGLALSKQTADKEGKQAFPVMLKWLRD